MLVPILLIACSLLPTTSPIYSVQSVGARGELGCPYRDEYTMQVYVELWDEDTCETLLSIIPPHDSHDYYSTVGVNFS